MPSNSYMLSDRGTWVLYLCIGPNLMLEMACCIFMDDAMAATSKPSAHISSRLPMLYTADLNSGSFMLHLFVPYELSCEGQCQYMHLPIQNLNCPCSWYNEVLHLCSIRLKAFNV